MSVAQRIMTPIEQAVCDGLLTVPTDTEGIARALYENGVNVFPIPYGQKSTTAKLRRLRYHRLLLQDDHINRTGKPRGLGLLDLIRRAGGHCNLAIMCGETSGGLAVIDCEDMDVFDHVAAQFRARGITVAGVKTAKGAHVYLRVYEGGLHNAAPAKHDGRVEVRAHNLYVVTAGSMHPTGALYTFLPGTDDTDMSSGAPVISIPTVQFEQLDGLEYAPGKCLHIALCQHVGRGRGGVGLRKSTREFASNGAPVGSRNNSLFSAANDAAFVGMDDTQIHAILGGAALRSGLSDREVRTTIASAEKRAAARRRNPTTDSETQFEKRERAAFDFLKMHAPNVHTTRLRTAARVFAAIVGQLRRLPIVSKDNVKGGGWVQISSRSLLAACDVADYRALASAIALLEQHGLIETSRGEHAAGAARSGATRPTSLFRLGARGEQLVEGCDKSQQDTRSVYNAAICCGLSQFTIAEFASARGMTNAAARQELRRGAASGLYERVGRGLYRVVPEAADARKQERADKRKKQARRIQEQRQTYTALLLEEALWAARNQPAQADQHTGVSKVEQMWGAQSKDCTRRKSSTITNGASAQEVE
ncbi:MAG: bifunctional DNA primase/polymerase [Chloroflexota bacterium]|nr:bifunctional DNA primase/polymerase [Chloroflexota bacterium]